MKLGYRELIVLDEQAQKEMYIRAYTKNISKGSY